MDALARRLVPDVLWDTAEPLIPKFTPRRQGGGTAPVDDRAVLVAIVFVLTSGCAWRQLPPSFGVSVPTAHRRFCTWAAAGFFDRLHQKMVNRLGAGGEVNWSAAIVDSASVRAKGGLADRP